MNTQSSQFSFRGRSQWELTLIRYTVYLLILGIVTTVAFFFFQKKWILFRKAESRIESGDYRGAQELLEKASAEGMDDTQAWTELGTAYLKLGNFAKAQEALERALVIHPTHLDAIRVLAGIYQHAGKVDEAIALYGRIPSQSLDGRAQLHLADLHRQKRDDGEAEKLYRGLLKNEISPYEAHLHLAELLSWNRRYDESIELYRQILILQPGNRIARLGLARVLSWSNRTEESIREYEAALKGEK